jgi:hypothetical protein
MMLILLSLESVWHDAFGTPPQPFPSRASPLRSRQKYDQSGTGYSTATKLGAEALVSNTAHMLMSESAGARRIVPADTIHGFSRLADPASKLVSKGTAAGRNIIEATNGKRRTRRDHPCS